MKKILSFSLSVVLLLSVVSLFGCKKETQSQNNKAEEVVIANFEQWEPDFKLMVVYDSFGKVSRNEDPAYVKSGKYSARLQPVGARASSSNPTVFIPLSSDRLEFSYNDITVYEELYAYMYNASDKDLSVTMGFASGYEQKSVGTVDGEKIKLPAGKWVRASYLFDVDLLNIKTDVTSAAGIYFMFDDMNVLYPKDAPSIYVDDVTLVKAAEKREPKNLIQLDKTQEGNENFISEICDFEKSYQKQAFKLTRGGPVDETIEARVVNAANYGLTAPSGEKVLHILRHAAATGTGNKTTVVLLEPLFKACGMADIPKEEWASTYICFDYCYTTENYKSIDLSWWVFTEGMKDRVHPSNLVQSGAKAGQWSAWTPIPYGSCPPKEWRTFRYSLYELSKGFQKTQYVTNPGGIMLSYDQAPSVDVDMFLDNFRLEKGEKLKYAE